MTTRELIDDFLGRRRLAIVGVSRQPRDFTRLMFREFQRRGYDAEPVNPAATEIEGRRCFARVQDVTPAVDAALLMTPPKATEAIVRDCLAAGVRTIWLYRATGSGAVSPQAVEFCQANGIDVIAGYCPHMFWKDSAFIHRMHGFFMKLTGCYPN